MTVNQFKPYIILFILSCLTAASVVFTGSVRVDDQLPVRLQLPEQVGKWRGITPYYCQNTECGIAVPLELCKTNPLSCATCGGAVAPVALAEKRGLPADTIVLKKAYHDEFTNRWISVSVVVSGSQRGSIHRPEWCLPGQGFTVRGQHIDEVRPSVGTPFSINLLDLDRQFEGNAAGKAFFAYWFISHGREMSSQFSRLVCMASDNVISGVSRRWAYVAILMATSSGVAGIDDAKRLVEFTGDFRPYLKSEP